MIDLIFGNLIEEWTGRWAEFGMLWIIFIITLIMLHLPYLRRKIRKILQRRIRFADIEKEIRIIRKDMEGMMSRHATSIGGAISKEKDDENSQT